MSTALEKSMARLNAQLEQHKQDTEFARIDAGRLIPYAAQVRTEFNLELLQELAESLKAQGIIEPLLVREVEGGKYEILAGERRWRAAKLAKIDQLPCLIRRGLTDAQADAIHLAENIHRENLSTLDLARRVQQDLEAAKGSLAAVADKYKKGKPWVSKLVAIAQGGDSMRELVEEGVTADRAVLSSVASLAKSAPQKAQQLASELKAAPAKANKRAIAERFMRTSKEESQTAQPKKTAKLSPDATAKEPAWRQEKGSARVASATVIAVELSPHSAYIDEFKAMTKKHGAASLSNTLRHSNALYVFVEFGKHRVESRVYLAGELRLLSLT
jgi:ParB family transcriptional regulator, chromosome partitioning protein